MDSLQIGFKKYTQTHTDTNHRSDKGLESIQISKEPSVGKKKTQRNQLKAGQKA